MGLSAPLADSLVNIALQTIKQLLGVNQMGCRAHCVNYKYYLNGYKSVISIESVQGALNTIWLIPINFIMDVRQ